MENSSPSATSQRSQTRFPPKAFNPWLTIAILVGALFIVFAVIFAAGVVAIAGGMTAAGVRTFFLGLPGVQVQIAGEVAAVLFLLFVLPHIAQMPMRDLGFRALTLSDAAYVAAGVAAMVLVVNGTASLLESALHTKVGEQAVTIFLNLKTPLAKAQFALLGVVVAAIFEETVFRLVIFNAVRKWAGFWTGAIVSSILFGLAHLQSASPQQGLILALPLALGGVILCAVYAKTQNAYASMLTHGIFNGVTLVALFFAPQLAK